MSTRPAEGTIALICAMPMELRPLVRKLSLQPTQVSGVRLHMGTMAGRPVVALVTGMGLKRATAGTERVLDALPVGHVVVVGITGAVENVTPIGTLILPEVVIDAATGDEHRPAPLGVAQALGKMWTTDELITDQDVIAGLRANGVVSLDMETAAIAKVCEQRGIPWSVFRAISDRATDGSIDQEVFGLSRPDGTPNGPSVARYFLKHPTRIPRMVRMARGARLATETAADAAIGACSAKAAT